MKVEFDINKEYEKIFGIKTRENLFNADDEEYNALRQSILDAKREFNPSKKLPFDGIRLLSYEDYQRNEIVREKEKLGHRIFYIRKYEGSKLVVYAAAYFDVKISRFYVLRDSFFQETAYYQHLVNSLDSTKQFNFKNSFNRKNGLLFQNTTISYDSASLAASYFLGKKVNYKAWTDDRGKTLDTYFVKYKTDIIDDSEEKSFPDYVAPAPPPPVKSELVEPIPQRVSSTTGSDSSHHLFMIDIPGTCSVTGYHDEIDNRFVILKGSLFAKKVDPAFNAIALGTSRSRFIDAACIERGVWYEVTKDTKCKSATAAASYVAGRLVSYTLWKDKNGKYLKDFYPTRFFQSGDNIDQEVGMVNPLSGNYVDMIHYFYIKKDSPERYCDAFGSYDPSTKKFVLKAGSILSQETAYSYIYTPQGEERIKFLKRFCTKVPSGYKLRSDYIFDSSSAAASFVMGRSANGWISWKDIDNATLDMVYRH